MTFRLLIVMLILALLVAFSLQNAQEVKVQLLVWSFHISRALLILVPFLVGIVLGWVLGAFGRSRRRAKADKLIPY